MVVFWVPINAGRWQPVVKPLPKNIIDALNVGVVDKVHVKLQDVTGI
jgi:hypothetical protein